MRKRHQTITTDPENWVSTDPISADLYADGDHLRLDIYDGEIFEVVAVSQAKLQAEFAGDDLMADTKGWTIKIFNVSHTGAIDEHPTVTVYWGPDVGLRGAVWEAYEGSVSKADYGGISRTASDPIAAAVKILANII